MKNKVGLGISGVGAGMVLAFGMVVACGSSSDSGAAPDAGRDGDSIHIGDPEPGSPSILSLTPANGEEHASVHTPFQAKFSKPLKLGAKPITMMVGDKAIAATASLSADEATLIVTPNEPLETPAKVSLFFGDIQDKHGNDFTDRLAWGFTAPLWLAVGTPLQGAFRGGVLDAPLTAIATGPGDRVIVASTYGTGHSDDSMFTAVIGGNDGTWAALGELISADIRQAPGLAVDTHGRVVEAYAPNDSNRSAVVRRWLDTHWEQVGQVMSPTYPDVGAGFHLVADSAGTLYVMYESPDASTTNYGHVMVQQFTGSSWSPLGTTVDDAADAQGYPLDMVLDRKGVPYVAYRNNAQIRVRAWVGGAWQPVGNPVEIVTSSFSYLTMSLSFSDQNELFGISRSLNASDKIHSRVVRYDANAKQWAAVGSELPTQDYTSATTMGYACIGAGSRSHFLGILQRYHQPNLAWDVTGAGYASLDAPAVSAAAWTCTTDTNQAPVIAGPDGNGANIFVQRLNR